MCRSVQKYERNNIIYYCLIYFSEPLHAGDSFGSVNEEGNTTLPKKKRNEITLSAL